MNTRFKFLAASNPLNRLPKWSWIPITLTLVLLLSSVFVGLTDDEAYYWVLAQKPALGYAFHPPMVAWFITLSQFLFGWIFGYASSAVVRIPSTVSIGIVFAMALAWIQSSSEIGADNRRSPLKMNTAALVLASFAGLIALGWMMVPDIPLFLGWMIAFSASWKIANTPLIEKVLARVFVLLALGVCLATLGKFSGVLVLMSAFFAILATPEGRKRMPQAFVALSLGFILALIPILIWNSQHEWQAILYQIQGRHSDSEFSLKRYLRYWLIELFAAGPVLVFFTGAILVRGLKKGAKRVPRFIAIWILPAAAIYCLQPLMSDFKPHWSFVVWWPGAIAMARAAARGPVRFSKFQVRYGLTLIVVILVSMNFPVLSLAMRHFKKSDFDPRLDVTNDLYGWSQLKDIVEQLPAEDKNLFIVGSRYQTASQAAFNMGSFDRITLLPRDLKARDEWSSPPISDSSGPEWPKITRPILFVTDNRYDAGPEFPGAKCVRKSEIQAFRGSISAKQIWLWICNPG